MTRVHQAINITVLGELRSSSTDDIPRNSRELFDSAIAQQVIHSNKIRILDSRIDVEHLATKLRESEAISKPVYDMVFDQRINMSTYDRCTQLIDNVERGIKHDGALFETLLQAFRECGEVPLADELHQRYSKLL